MYSYEGMFLVDPVAYGSDPESTTKVVTDLLEKHGAKIHQLERWDERKLAFEIKGHKRGVYLLGYFEMPGASVDAMRREVAITEALLRILVIRLDGDIPGYLEQSARYHEKIREDQEARRSERGGRREDGDDSNDDDARSDEAA